MAGLKSLAKDTAIYGLSSIVGRVLNYMPVPIYTGVLARYCHLPPEVMELFQTYMRLQP